MKTEVRPDRVVGRNYSGELELTHLLYSRFSHEVGHCGHLGLPKQRHDGHVGTQSNPPRSELYYYGITFSFVFVEKHVC